MKAKIVRPGPVDYIFTGSGSQPITFAFYYPQNLDADILQKCLRQTVLHFPILTTKLVKTKTDEYEYHMSEDRLILETLKSNVPFDHTQTIGQYITPVSSAENNPLTKIILTRIPNGSVLAVSISHALVDGFSYFHFLSSWARLCRGERILIPDLKREAWSGFVCQKSRTITSDDIYFNCGLFWEGKRPEYQQKSVQVERIFLSKKTIRSHLEEIKPDYPFQTLFENDIICAYLWKKYLPEWIGKNQNPVTHLNCPFDFRRIYKSIARNYLGCAICFTTAATHLDNLKKKSIGELAVLVNRANRSVNEQYIRKFLQTLVDFRCQKGVAAFEEIHLRHPGQGLIVTNLTRLPMRDLDFGSGKPEDFLAYVDVQGGAAILPAENGVEVLISQPCR